MSNTTSSANMLLPVPVVGMDPGPQYALDVNSCLTLIDQHDHSPSKGVQVTPAGLNINSDLTFNNNNLTSPRCVRFESQPAILTLPNDLDCVYVVDVDLYYNDGNGNNVRITQGGSVAGASGSITGLVSPASASYNAGSKTFIWESDANTPANMDAAAYTFRNLVANSSGLTLLPPNSMSSDYSITLPFLPGSTLPLVISNTGAIAASQITTSQVANAAITTALIADGSVTRPKLAALAQQISSSSGSYANSSLSPVAITNLTVTITTSGRPVMLMLQDDGTIGSSYVGYFGCSAGTASLIITSFVRNGTPINSSTLQTQTPTAGEGHTVPASSFMFLDTPTAGTYTYTVQCHQNVAGGLLFEFNNVVLVAYEM